MSTLLWKCLHALALESVRINFDVGVFTNLSQDHLDFHSDMNEYAKLKPCLSV